VPDRTDRSDAPQNGEDRPLPAAAPRGERARGEVVDARPAGLLTRLEASPLAGPVVAATGGFIVGFATFIAARVVRGRRPGRLSGRRRRRALERQIESSRSFLVYVHTLRR
jgi:hypothetical protein